MTDPIHAALKWASHNRYTALGLASARAASVYVFGCQSRTASLIEPSKTVSRTQFEQELNRLEGDLGAEGIALDLAREKLNADVRMYNAKVDTLNRSAETGTADLNHQDEVRAQVVSTFTNMLPNLLAGKFDLARTLTTSAGLFGLLAGGGAVVDNRRKDRIIKAKKTTPPTP